MATATVSWPTQADLEPVYRELWATFNAFDDLTAGVDEFAERVGDVQLRTGDWRPLVPTFAQIGVLSHFIAVCEVELEAVTGSLDKLRKLHDAGALVMGGIVEPEVGGNA